MGLTGNASAAAARRTVAVRAAVGQGIVGEHAPVAALLDVHGIRAAAAALHSAFDEAGGGRCRVLHTFAVKACALVPVVRLLADEGLGCEVASPGELALARAAGVPPARTVLDSPAKTPDELREALALGIAVNADSREELSRLDALVAAAPTASALGVRVNPQVGGGSIGATSTATAGSKFGVPLRDAGAREWLLRAYAQRPWLTAVHTHVGSQGCPLGLLAEGVRAVYELAEEINRAAGRQQVRTVDIGGGLPVDFSSDEAGPDFGAYARLLAATAPGLFDGRYQLVTEFGRSLVAKSGTVLARVEATKSAGGRRIAVTHAGAQVATRTVYAPEAWPLRVAALDALGRPKAGDAVPQDVAGPCCFAGDLLAAGCALPLLEAGDHVALLDTGAYYFSAHYAYNSLVRPGVYGYAVGGGAEVAFATVREPQSLDGVVAESGGAYVAGLRGLG
ncbi:diaminopimelate decarboxylase [Streptomyces gamaensis]|uniref:Diaminopimelate decarboxylase n=1 Tax=Streptomyces gamaensis TaxID=1763542 RepID=A0ABW0Z4D5_9ACTN